MDQKKKLFPFDKTPLFDTCRREGKSYAGGKNHDQGVCRFTFRGAVVIIVGAIPRIAVATNLFFDN